VVAQPVQRAAHLPALCGQLVASVELLSDYRLGRKHGMHAQRIVLDQLRRHPRRLCELQSAADLGCRNLVQGRRAAACRDRTAADAPAASTAPASATRNGHLRKRGCDHGSGNLPSSAATSTAARTGTGQLGRGQRPIGNQGEGPWFAAGLFLGSMLKTPIKPSRKHSVAHVYDSYVTTS
jgi:hypothetical protein